MMCRMTRRITLLMAALLLAGCNSHKAPEPEGKRYPVQGTIKALDPPKKTATIDAGQIGDWMAPMTMDYVVKPDAEFEKLHVGDRIEATVVVIDPEYHVTSVKVLPKQ